MRVESESKDPSGRVTFRKQRAQCPPAAKHHSGREDVGTSPLQRICNNAHGQPKLHRPETTPSDRIKVSRFEREEKTCSLWKLTAASYGMNDYHDVDHFSGNFQCSRYYVFRHTELHGCRAADGGSSEP